MWTIDKLKCTASHSNGLEVEIHGNAVININTMPNVLKTAELPGLLKDAVRTYRAEGETTPSIH